MLVWHPQGVYDKDEHQSDFIDTLSRSNLYDVYRGVGSSSKPFWAVEQVKPNFIASIINNIMEYLMVYLYTLIAYIVMNYEVPFPVVWLKMQAGTSGLWGPLSVSYTDNTVAPDYSSYARWFIHPYSLPQSHFGMGLSTQVYSYLVMIHLNAGFTNAGITGIVICEIFKRRDLDITINHYAWIKRHFVNTAKQTPCDTSAFE